MPEPHEWLDEAMNERRLQLRMNWRDIAAQAGISYEALRAIRRGDSRPTELTMRGLDEALRWVPGGVQTALRRGKPVPLDANSEQSPSQTEDTADSLSSQELEILQDLVVSTASRLGLSPEETDEAYRRARVELERRRAEAQGESLPRRRRTG